MRRDRLLVWEVLEVGPFACVIKKADQRLINPILNKTFLLAANATLDWNTASSERQGIASRDTSAQPNWSILLT